MISNSYLNVSAAASSWTLRSAEPTAKAALLALPAHAIMPRRHRGAAATVASVNRGTT
jgi:hypothetical protein